MVGLVRLQINFALVQQKEKNIKLMVKSVKFLTGNTFLVIIIDFLFFLWYSIKYKNGFAWVKCLGRKRREPKLASYNEKEVHKHIKITQIT